MRKKISKNVLYYQQQALSQSIHSIPKKNKQKFFNDLLTLIDLAHEDNYENFKTERN